MYVQCIYMHLGCLSLLYLLRLGLGVDLLLNEPLTILEIYQVAVSSSPSTNEQFWKFYTWNFRNSPSKSADIFWRQTRGESRASLH